MNPIARSLYIASLAALAGCAAHSHSPDAAAPRTVTMATEEQSKAMLGQLKTLEGEWTMQSEGKTIVASVFKVSSNDSVVRETMFPGTQHEMTNVYHMDGRDLVMTHYCAGGNQPRMRCTAASGGKYDLKFDGITNLGDTTKPYMAEMTLTIVDADHITQAWRSYKDGKLTTEHNPVFELTRKKSW